MDRLHQWYTLVGMLVSYVRKGYGLQSRRPPCTAFRVFWPSFGMRRLLQVLGVCLY
jgi:hypothetical protein